MTKSAIIRNRHIKQTMIQYFNTCDSSSKPLSDHTSIEVSYTTFTGLSIRAMDIATMQAATIEPSGLVQRYTLCKAS